MNGCTILEVTPTLQMADNKSLRIVSYNLYGLNSGRSMLQELCNDTRVAVVAVQVHWLTPHNLNFLNEVHPDYVGFGTSAIHSKLKPKYIVVVHLVELVFFGGAPWLVIYVL